MARVLQHKSGETDGFTKKYSINRLVCGFEKEGQFGQFAVDLGGVTCTSPSLAAD